MQPCRFYIRASVALGIAVLNYIFAFGTFGQLFACADMWGKCTPSRLVVLSNKALSLPLSLISLSSSWSHHVSIAAGFALNAAVWGLLAFGAVSLICRVAHLTTHSSGRATRAAKFGR